jgi:tetratricopeptide (TPR) repeat protein
LLGKGAFRPRQGHLDFDGPRGKVSSVNDLLSGLLGALLSTNVPVATSNLIQQQTGLQISVAEPSDPVEQELRELMILDDEAHDEVDRWIKDNNRFKAAGGGMSDAELNIKILNRLAVVRTNYLHFLAEHTNHARAHLAYASFLSGIGEEEEAVQWMEKARDIDPSNPAAWNNLANYHGHRGSVKTAFDYYEKAIALNPREPVYYHNYGTTVFLFRKDAREHFGITEQEVFDKALKLYAKSLALDPLNFPLATDIATTYYGIKPERPKEAFTAWEYAMSIARDQIERDGVHIHLARWNREIGNYDEARRHLHIITNTMYDDLKQRIMRSVEDEEAEANGEIPEDSATDEKEGENEKEIASPDRDHTP